jgi:hypothetical protein
LTVLIMNYQMQKHKIIRKKSVLRYTLINGIN